MFSILHTCVAALMLAVGLLDHTRWQQLTRTAREQMTQDNLISGTAVRFSFHVTIVGEVALIVRHRLERMRVITVRREGNKGNQRKCKRRRGGGEV